jgi:hypothetical protein
LIMVGRAYLDDQRSTRGVPRQASYVDPDIETPWWGPAGRPAHDAHKVWVALRKGEDSHRKGGHMSATAG